MLVTNFINKSFNYRRREETKYNDFNIYYFHVTKEYWAKALVQKRILKGGISANIILYTKNQPKLNKIVKPTNI